MAPPTLSPVATSARLLVAVLAGTVAGGSALLTFHHGTAALLAALLTTLALSWLLRLSALWTGMALLATALSTYQLLPDTSSLPPTMQVALGLIIGLYLLVQLPTIVTRVPVFPTNRQTITALNNYLHAHPEFRTFVDLGSGFGGVLFGVAAANPAVRCIGYELAPMPFLTTWLRSLLYRNVSVRYASFWNHQVNSEQLLYCFLSPLVMEQIGRTFVSKQQAALVSHQFQIPGMMHTSEIAAKLYRY